MGESGNFLLAGGNFVLGGRGSFIPMGKNFLILMVIFLRGRDYFPIREGHFL